MNDISISQLRKQARTDEAALIQAKKRLTTSPEGTLAIRTIRNHPRFYRCFPIKNDLSTYANAVNTADINLANASDSNPANASDSNPAAINSVKHSAADSPRCARRQEYLGKNKTKLIRQLAEKRYCRDLCKALTDELTSIHNFLDNYHPQEKYFALEKLPVEIREYISPLFISQEEKCRTWQNQPYETNTYIKTPGTSYQTSRGEEVRSRAECILCDKIARKSLAYRYEEALKIGNTTLYPDITIMHPVTCKKYYIEFFGMMDNPTYAAKAFNKILTYQAAGLDPYLITLFDSKETPFNFNKLDRILDSYFGETE